MGITVRDKPGDVAATVIPSVGCPLGCNFCSTSAMFGGKGKFVNFYETGDELFDVMCQLEARDARPARSSSWTRTSCFHRKRALRLLELMEEHDKAWSLYVFSSANVLRSYTIDQLVRLGISWVWMGLEGKDSQYTKLNGIDTFELVRELQSHGIRVLGSTIIGLENHTPENIDEAIDYAARHDTDFHQFMLYTPIPGTPLHAELTAKGLMKDESEFDLGDIHGQFIFNYRHPHITRRAGGRVHAAGVRPRFRASTARASCGSSAPRWPAGGATRTTPTCGSAAALPGKPANWPRRSRPWSARPSSTTATTRRCTPRCRPALERAARRVRLEVAAVRPPSAGATCCDKIRQEEKRLAAGWTYEPPTFYETNFAPPGRFRGPAFRFGARQGSPGARCRRSARELPQVVALGS